MKRRSAMVGGMALGAGLMFFLDPSRGRRRRALVRDKAFHLARAGRGGLQFLSRGIAQRAREAVARTASLLTAELVSDEVLAERVRSQLGHVLSHPGSVDVSVSERRVTLRGPVLSREVDVLLERIAGVRGVAVVDNKLEIHDVPNHVPGLQGGDALPAGASFLSH